MTDTLVERLTAIRNRMLDRGEYVTNEWADVVDASAIGEAISALQEREKDAQDVVISRDVAQALVDSLKSLREAGVFVWPNHPLNPESTLRAAIDKDGGK
jgi:hypothetical protein